MTAYRHDQGTEVQASSPRQPGGTWYLLVELKGISATFLFRSRISFTEPEDSSMHLSRADSEASPATSLWGNRGPSEQSSGGGHGQGQGEGGSWTYLEHRDVVLTSLEDGTVAESGNVGQGHPGVRALVKRGA